METPLPDARSLRAPIPRGFSHRRAPNRASHEGSAQPRDRFAHDSALEEGVTSETRLCFPASREFTGKFIETGLGRLSIVGNIEARPVPYGEFPTHSNRE